MEHLPACLPVCLYQEALVDCVRRVVFQENAPMGQPMTVRMLISRSQEQGVMGK
jgi:hypothetical protein